MTAMSQVRPLFIHIGLQKTGTSYLQSIFWESVDALKAMGLDMVPATRRETFYLMLQVRGRYDPELDPPVVAESLDRLPRRLAAAHGSRALITEESLAGASEEQIRSLLDRCTEREVHLVVTVRDLARQIPSAWHEELRAGSSIPFEIYLRRLRRTEGDPHHHLWRTKDVPNILQRWSKFVPAERIHIVTVPPSGSDPELLLRRFCQVLDVDPQRLDRDVARSNASLGRVQAEVLRQVNELLPEPFRQRQFYGEVGKRYFANEVLGSGDKVLLPSDIKDWVFELSRQHVDHIRGGGFDVVGDLDDLQPSESVFADEVRVPDREEVAEVAVRALATMLTDRMERMRKNRELQEQRPLARLRRTPLGRRLADGRDALRTRLGRQPRP
jgi:hypothetical protein